MFSGKSRILTNGYNHPLLVLSMLGLARCEVLTELMLKILVFGGATLCH